MNSLEHAGDRIEDLLGQLADLPDRRAVELAEALVRVITDLYGEGLARMVEAGGPDFTRTVAEDDLVAGLLALHTLHPTSLRTRVAESLAGLDEMLGVQDVRVLEADEETATVRVRLLMAPGRGAHKDALVKVVRDAVERSAPEVVHVVVDCPDTGVPVTLRTSAKPVAATSS